MAGSIGGRMPFQGLFNYDHDIAPALRDRSTSCRSRMGRAHPHLSTPGADLSCDFTGLWFIAFHRVCHGMHFYQCFTSIGLNAPHAFSGSPTLDSQLEMGQSQLDARIVAQDLSFCCWVRRPRPGPNTETRALFASFA